MSFTFQSYHQSQQYVAPRLCCDALEKMLDNLMFKSFKPVRLNSIHSISEPNFELASRFRLKISWFGICFGDGTKFPLPSNVNISKVPIANSFILFGCMHKITISLKLLSLLLLLFVVVGLWSLIKRDDERSFHALSLLLGLINSRLASCNIILEP